MLRRRRRFAPERPCPAFVISYNRGEMLAACVAALQRQSRAVEVVVQDNGSDDPVTLAVLESLERSHIQVVRGEAISSAAALDGVADTVAEFLGERPDRDFIVTDCDVDLSGADRDAIRAYEWLLDVHREVDCVGPMLTIRDIPMHYPLRDRALKGHVEQFWGQLPDVESSPYGLIASIAAPIDTTFALHRRGTRFRRLRAARRVYHPYEARHLDWYITESEFSNGAGTDLISHWGNADWLAMESSTAPPELEYFVARRVGRERLVLERRHTSDPPDPPSAPGW